MSVSIPSDLDVAQVLERVRDWPKKQRVELVDGILDTLRDDPSSAGRQRATLKDLVGVLGTDGNAPTDEELQRILEDELIEKYCR